MQPVTIIHACETLPGGPASYLSEILPYQTSKNSWTTIEIVYPDVHSHCINRVCGLMLHPVGGGASRIGRTFFLFAKLLKLLIARKSGVVHMHSTYAGFGGRLLFPLFRWRFKFVYCSHGWAFNRNGPRWINRIYERYERLFANLCHSVVCISSHDYAEALRIGISKKRLALVINGVSSADRLESSDQGNDNIARSLRLARASAILLFVGRLDQQKGFDLLQDAMRLMPTFELRVIGSPVVNGVTVDNRISNISHLGWQRRDIVRVEMERCDILVVPSRWEGFGLVAAEALSVGRPVVASDVGGLREIVENGVTGVLVEPNNVSKLRAGILTCLRKLENGGYPEIQDVFQKRFTAERMNPEIWRLYDFS